MQYGLLRFTMAAQTFIEMKIRHANHLDSESLAFEGKQRNLISAR